MLDLKLTGDILEVKETVWSLHSTRVQWWYYDIKNWRGSSTGKKDAPLDRDLDSASIEWVKKHYLPKVT